MHPTDCFPARPSRALVWVFAGALFLSAFFALSGPLDQQAEPRLWTDDYSNVFQLIY